MPDSEILPESLASCCRKSAAAAVSKDIDARRREFVFRLPTVERWLAPKLCDQRDRPVLHVLANVLLITVPSAAAVFAVSGHLFGLGYLILNYVLLLQRFLVALLHISEHRRLFVPGQ